GGAQARAARAARGLGARAVLAARRSLKAGACARGGDGLAQRERARARERARPPGEAQQPQQNRGASQGAHRSAQKTLDEPPALAREAAARRARQAQLAVELDRAGERALGDRGQSVREMLARVG